MQTSQSKLHISSRHKRKMLNAKLVILFAVFFVTAIVNAISPSFADTGGGGGGGGNTGGGAVGSAGYWHLYYDDGWFDSSGNFQPNWGYDGTSVQRWWDEVHKTVDIRGTNSDNETHESTFRNACWQAINNAKARSGSPQARVIAIGFNYFRFSYGPGYGLRHSNTFDQLLGGNKKNTSGWSSNAGWTDDVREKIYNQGRNDLTGSNYSVVVIAVGSTEVPGYGSIKVNKTSADSSITYGNSNYQYKDAVYGIYRDSACTDLAHRLTLDSNGNGTQTQVKPGTYYIQEITAPKGYLKSKNVYQVTVKAGGTASASVQETPKKGRIIVKKIDAVTTETVDKAGFTFELYDSTGKLKQTQVTTDDSNGTATFDNLPFGAYTVKETACPSPYLKNDEPVNVSCGETENEYTVVNIEVADKLPYGSATIKKLDSVKGQLTPGTKFVVRATEDIDRIDGSIIYHKGDPIEYVTTSANDDDTYGMATTSEPLYIGADGDGQYEFIEVSVPTGVVIDKTPIPFSFSWEGDTVEQLTKANVTQTNNIAYGSAKITKTDNVLSEAVPNVSYKIVPTKDITLQNGTIIYKKGETVETISTDADGIAKSTSHLYVSSDGTGDYAFIEMAVPGNMTIDSTPIPFTIEYAGQDTEVLPEEDREQTNNVTYGSAQITKKESTKSSLVPYAEYDVVATEDITLWNGHRIYKKDQIIEHVTTGQDGVAKTRKRLYIGSDGDGRYEFVETAVRAPLTINTKPIPFTLTYKDNKTEYVGEQSVEQTNDIAYGSAQITKTDKVESDLVPDTEYDVVADENINLWNATIYKKGQTVDHVKTGADGVAHTSKPLYVGITGSGRYKFIETKVPAPLTIDTAPIIFTIKYKNQQVLKLDNAMTSHMNNDAYGSVSLKKTETSTNGPVQGAVFDIVATEDIVLWNKSIYKNGQVIETITTDDNGLAMSTKPLYIGADSNGTYKLVEKSVPCPYYNDGKDVPFTISYKDQNTEFVGNVETSKTNNIAKTSVKLTKNDAENGAPCAGAIYRLAPNEDVTLPNGNVVTANGKKYTTGTAIATLVTGNDGTVTSDDILYIGASGKTSYKLIEIKAPSGYVINKDPVIFSVSYENQNTEIVQTARPSTSDETNMVQTEKTVTDKSDDNVAISNVSVPNAKFRLWNRGNELKINTRNDNVSYALRVDGGKVDGDVKLTRIDDNAEACVATDGYEIILKDSIGNTTDIKNKDSISIVNGTYNVSLRKSANEKGNSSTDKSADIKFDGSSKLTIKNGEKVTFSVKEGKNATTLLTDKSEIDGDEITADKKHEAYIISDLKQDTDYRVKFNGETIYTLHTPNKAVTLYGRYNTNAKTYKYKKQGMLLTSDSLYIDKFTVNGEDYPVQTVIGTDGTLTIKRITPGEYGYGEVDVPVMGDTTSETHKSYLVNTGVTYFTVDATTGQINNSDSAMYTIENDYTDVRFRKVDEEGSDVSGATMQVTSTDGDIVDEWVTDGTTHYIPQLVPGTYYFIEKLTPEGYDQTARMKIEVTDTGDEQTFVMSDNKISVGAKVDKRQEIADPVAHDVSENGDGKNRANLTPSDTGEYEYSVDYKNTANTWTDEYTVYDALDGVNDGFARLDGLTTPQASGDFDGKMNVWYQTSKTPADYADDKDKANATLDDNHDNPLNVGENATEAMKDGDKDGDGRILDYTGWRLWKEDVQTDVAETLNVSDLKLDNDEYVTGIRFEYGRVNKGFTTRPSLWVRGDLKDEHDDVDAVAHVYDDEFNADVITSTKSAMALLKQAMDDIHKEYVTDDDDNNNTDYSDNDTSDKSDNDGTDDDADSNTDSENDMSIYGATGDMAERLKEAIDANDIDAVRAIATEIGMNDVEEIKILIKSLDKDGITSLKKTMQQALSVYESKESREKLDKAFDDADNKDPESIDTLIEEISITVTSMFDAQTSGTTIHYAPAVIKMHVLDTYVPEANLINSVTVDAWRNGSQGGDADAGKEEGVTDGKPIHNDSNNNGNENKSGETSDGNGNGNATWSETAGHDSDMVTQTPKFDDLANDLVVENDLVQTGINLLPYVLIAVIGMVLVAYTIKKR